jgi:hypothetical protein
MILFKASVVCYKWPSSSIKWAITLKIARELGNNQRLQDIWIFVLTDWIFCFKLSFWLANWRKTYVLIVLRDNGSQTRILGFKY